MSSTKGSLGADNYDGWGVIRLPFGGERGGGFLILPYAGERITAEFHAAKMELILLLNEELLADIKADMPPEAWGWRSPDDLIPLLNDPLQQADNLRRTVSTINRTFRTAAAQALPGERVPRLIATKRLIGVRLQWPFRLDFPDDRIAS